MNEHFLGVDNTCYNCKYQRKAKKRFELLFFKCKHKDTHIKHIDIWSPLEKASWPTCSNFKESFLKVHNKRIFYRLSLAANTILQLLHLNKTHNGITFYPRQHSDNISDYK